jgi:hypothetical protein
MKATLFRVNSTSEVTEVATTKDYAAIKAIVAPLLGFRPNEYPTIEHVTVWHDGKLTDMFVDEVGHQKLLHRNDAATEIYRAATMAGKIREPVPDDPETLPWIAGDAVLFDERVWK